MTARSYASENELLRKAKELNIELTQGMIEVILWPLWTHDGSWKNSQKIECEKF